MKEHHKAKYRPWDKPWYEEKTETRNSETIDFLVMYGWVLFALLVMVILLYMYLA